LGFAHVVAAVFEHTRLIPQRVVEGPAERHESDVASRSEKRGGKGSVVEIEIHAAGELFQAEGNLELAGTDLRYSERACLDVNVAPRLARVAQLDFNLVLEFPHQPAFDANARPGQINHRLGWCLGFVWEVAKVDLGLEANAHRQQVPNLDRR